MQLLTSMLTGDCEAMSRDELAFAARVLDIVLDRAEAGGGIDHGEGVIRRLNLTTALLACVAPNAEVRILDPRAAYDLFLREVPYSPDEARALAQDWPALDIAVIRRLRFAKNLVTPLLAISGLLDEANVPHELAAWEEVRQLLP